jgi:hypothetical protein
MAGLPAWLVVTRSPDVREVLARPDPAELSARGPGPRPSHLALLGDPAVLRALVLVLASAPGLMFMYVWLPQYLELGRALSKPRVASLVWIPALLADLGMVGFGLVASAMERRSPVQRSHVPLVLLAASMEATLALVPRIGDPLPAVLLIGVAAAGGGGLYTLLTSDMMTRVDPARVSMSGGLTAAAQSLIYVFLNPLVGRWIDRTHSFDGAMAMLGLMALPGALVWSVIPVRPLRRA